MSITIKLGDGTNATIGDEVWVAARDPAENWYRFFKGKIKGVGASGRLSISIPASYTRTGTAQSDYTLHRDGDSVYPCDCAKHLTGALVRAGIEAGAHP